MARAAQASASSKPYCSNMPITPRGQQKAALRRYPPEYRRVPLGLPAGPEGPIGPGNAYRAGAFLSLPRAASKAAASDGLRFGRPAMMPMLMDADRK